MVKPFQLLIVDDDDDDKKFFCEAIAEIDKSVLCTSAEDGVDALRLLSDERFCPDYIFLDLNMPKMSGKELLKSLKADEKLKRIPVVVFSTSKSEDEIEETKKLGAIHFITKPTDINHLIKELSNFFYQSETYR